MHDLTIRHHVNRRREKSLYAAVKSKFNDTVLLSLYVVFCSEEHRINVAGSLDSLESLLRIYIIYLSLSDIMILDNFTRKQETYNIII